VTFLKFIGQNVKTDDIYPQPYMPKLPRQVWILACGRLLSEIGTGFTVFYAPIYFVQQVGLSATSVGLALGSASISGIVGRIVSGAGADRWGRKPMLLFSTLASAISCIIFAIAQDFGTLVVGCLAQGVGLGLYWPANEAVVADLTEGEECRLAYAVTRLADNIGMGIGIIAGGFLLARGGAYRSLFIIDGISFAIFGTILALGLRETIDRRTVARTSFGSGYVAALRDRRLQVYILVNILFTTYVSQTQSTVPLYFSNFVAIGDRIGFTPDTISALFAWHLLATIALQLPVLKMLGGLTHPRALAIAMLAWAAGFICMSATGTISGAPILLAAIGLTLFALAIASYIPTSSALIAELAPSALRGAYTSINSLCWAVGYAIGPVMGGWALDRGASFARGYWLGLAGSIAIAIPILWQLEKLDRFKLDN
jgi:MFS family permease